MRIDKDYLLFGTHHDWYKVIKGVGYVPTDKAPKEAREAMKRFNKNSFFLKKGIK